ncbi:MAG TPA: biotin/lipoyl-containing protein, partial [Trebonia sp.]
MIEIKMPRLSDTMEEGAISTWRKQPGDTVAVGDVLVEIETDKAVMEYEAYEAGTLAKILVPEGKNADIGVPIALLDDGTGTPATPASSAIPASGGERRFASPLVRKLAREHHLDLSRVSGSGPGGRIIRADISDLLIPSPSAPTSSALPAPSVPAPAAADVSAETPAGPLA